VSAARGDVSGAMRPEFDDNTVFPRPILARLGRSGIVKGKATCSHVAIINPRDVVATS